MRFFIVDADAGFSSSLEQSLKSRGVECVVLSDAQAAFDALKREAKNAHLVLLSKEQAGESEGLAVLERIRKDLSLRNVPVILLSSLWGKKDFAKHQKTESGANGYFSKLSKPSELEDAIEAVLGIKLPAKAPSASPPPVPSRSSAKKSGAGADPGFDVKLIPVEEVFKGAPREALSVKIFDDLPAPVPPPLEVTLDHQPSQGLIASVDAMLGKAERTEGVSSLSVTMEPSIPAASAMAPPLSAASTPEATSATSPSAIEISLSSFESPSVDAGASLLGTSPPPPAPEATAAPMTLEETPPAAPTAIDRDVHDAHDVHDVHDADDAAKDLPYLFSDPPVAGATPGGGTRLTSLRARKQPFDMKIHLPGAEGPGILGGEAGSTPNDIETLKRYLAMREQDVSVLTVQLSYAKEELSSSQKQIEELAAQNEELLHLHDGFKKRLAELESEKAHVGANARLELEQARADLKEKSDRIKLIESKLSDSSKDYERLKDRVRVDIRKIRAREKELESKLEILKKDSETLIASRENKILELKRKIDLLEFNYDVLLDKNEGERQSVSAANEKIEKILKVLRLALGMVEGAGSEGPPGPGEPGEGKGARAS